MSGKRLRSYRQGDIAEGTGLELLRRVSLVAPVPRSEDVGVDAVCTLLRRENKVLFAEDTFAVQAKAASVSDLELDEEDWRWLGALDLPLFWLSVDLRSSSAALYTLVNAFAPGTFALGARPVPAGRTRLVLQRPANSISPETQPWLVLPRPGDAPTLTTWVGPPVLQFQFEEADTEAFGVRAYEALKAHTTAFFGVIRARRMGVHHGLRWETGGEPSLAQIATGGTGADLRAALEGLCDPLFRAETLLGDQSDQEAELREAFATIKRKAVALGIVHPNVF